MRPVGELPTEEERRLLRDSLRSALEAYWPPAGAIKRSADLTAIATVWGRLIELGVGDLGREPAEGGLRESVLVMEELGRAACPVPMLGAVLANLAGIAYSPGARICVSLGSVDRGLHAGHVTTVNGKAVGTVRFVDGAPSATHLAVVMNGGQEIGIVDLSDPAASVVAAQALGTDGLGEIQLSGSAVAVHSLPLKLIRDLGLIARMLVSARAYGAAHRAFQLVMDYAKERKQFGKPIGSFQAIQHKLANCHIALEGVRLTVANAALNYDVGVDDWRYFTSAAIAYAGGALRQVSLETHHAFGAIGYAEEHEAPRHFRRVHLDVVAMGGVRQARAELAAYLFDDSERKSLPRYDLGAAGNAFRDEVRAWLRKNWSGDRKAAFDQRPFHEREFDPQFARDLGKTGWIGLAWPKQFGGQGRSPYEQIAFIEEMERAETPRVGAPIQANALMLYGTREQKAKYLPEILRGEAMHGMGYSEPNAGSDLASLRTRATREGDQWVINGQKIWTTTWWGQYMFLGARTDPHAKPQHAGISTFIVPMDTPGIAIKQSKTLYDGTFANIFYDDVRLPADALLGAENDGWRVLTGALATERGLVGGGIVMKVVHSFEVLCDVVRQNDLNGRPMHEDPLVRERLATLAAEIEVGRQLMMDCAARTEGGVSPPDCAAISKVFSGELMERFGETALDLLGMLATLSQGAPGVVANGRFEQGLRHSLMWVISIGTNEIQRSLIAQVALGLPR